MDLRNELEQLKSELGLLQGALCSFGENEVYRRMLKNNEPLPEGVVRTDPDRPVEVASFYKRNGNPLSREELSEYVQYKQLKAITTIKNCVVFFTVLIAISIVISFLTML